MSSLIRLMVSHPNSVGESYFEHMWFALRFAALLSAAAFCALVHAVLPFCFETTASGIIRKLYDRIENRGHAEQTENGPQDAARLIVTD
jgi:hypothetical protein